MTFFWAIFVTLMLPVEVRIVPTYGVVASLGMLDSYAGLIIPLIASATATFLFRQFFLSVPDELAEAARVDGAWPMRFFWDILLPMSRTTIAALFVIQFIYGWNQYLWPLLITTKESFYTVVMTVSRQANVVDAVPSWNLLMAMAMLAMLPPVLVVVFMQRQFVRGLVETEKVRPWRKSTCAASRRPTTTRSRSSTASTWRSPTASSSSSSAPRAAASPPCCAWWPGWSASPAARSRSATAWSTSSSPRTATSPWCSRTTRSIRT